ncbi:QcrA and Rieske domain-containing protein [Spirosoma koreense]
MDKASLTRHDFFRIVGTSVGAILLTHCSAGCSKADSGDPTPTPGQKVDFTLKLADQTNENLRTKGGYVVVNDIIVAQTKDGNFIAVSANCTHQGTLLLYKPNDNQFYCPLHLSRFDSTGKVLMGPATQSLVQYTVVADTAAGTVRIHA